MKNHFIVKEPIILMDYLTIVLEKPRKKAKALLTNECVYVNNKVVTQYNHPLLEGNTVLIKDYNKDNIPKNIEIIYEDKDIIVVNKPNGLLTVSTENEKEKTLFHMVSDYVKVKNKNARIFIVHRLDKETSGIILFAKSDRVKKSYQDDWEKLALYRGYVAVVSGVPALKENKVTEYLKELENMKVYKTKEEDGKKAVTYYKVTRTNNKFSLLDIKIDTGRKNQIRVCMQNMGNPVVGDKKYGSTVDPVKRMCLHAHKLKVLNPITNKEMEFISKMPTSFLKLTK
ncbi:MAG: RluA family pseudouridine synthase [Bacilli bacterium]